LAVQQEIKKSSLFSALDSRSEGLSSLCRGGAINLASLGAQRTAQSARRSGSSAFASAGKETSEGVVYLIRRVVCWPS